MFFQLFQNRFWFLGGRGIVKINQGTAVNFTRKYREVFSDFFGIKRHLASALLLPRLRLFQGRPAKGARAKILCFSAFRLLLWRPPALPCKKCRRRLFWIRPRRAPLFPLRLSEFQAAGQCGSSRLQTKARGRQARCPRASLPRPPWHRPKS